MNYGTCCFGIAGVCFLLAFIFIIRQFLKEDEHKREQDKESEFVGMGSQKDLDI